MPTASIVTAAVVAAGEVSDFTPTVRLELREKVAAEAGVDVAAVTLTIEAASVLLTFEIALPASVDADAANAALTTQLADPAAASAFLSTASFVVSVESIEAEPTIDSRTDPPADEGFSLEEELSGGGDGGAGGAVAAGVIIGVLGLFVATAAVLRREDIRRWWQAQRAKRGGAAGKGGQYTSSTSAADVESSLAESSLVSMESIGVGGGVAKMARDSKPAPPHPSLWKSASSLEDVDLGVEPVVEVAVKEVARAMPGSVHLAAVHVELAGAK